MREVMIFAGVCALSIVVMAMVYTYAIQDDETPGND